jgi:hypothetical protein
MNRRAMRIRMEERRREIYMYQQDSFIGQHFHPSKPKRNTAAAAKKKNCTNNIRKIPKWLCLCVILLYDLHSKSVVNHSRNPSQTVLKQTKNGGQFSNAKKLSSAMYLSDLFLNKLLCR